MHTNSQRHKEKNDSRRSKILSSEILTIHPDDSKRDAGRRDGHQEKRSWLHGELSDKLRLSKDRSQTLRGRGVAKKVNK